MHIEIVFVLIFDIVPLCFATHLVHKLADAL